MDVGVREFKQHLSAYLERAARGERLRITDRGRRQALLRPLPCSAAIERGIAEGWIRPGEDRRPQAVQRTRSRRGVVELLREDRDGR